MNGAPVDFLRNRNSKSNGQYRGLYRGLSGGAKGASAPRASGREDEGFWGRLRYYRSRLLLGWVKAGFSES